MFVDSIYSFDTDCLLNGKISLGGVMEKGSVKDAIDSLSHDELIETLEISVNKLLGCEEAGEYLLKKLESKTYQKEEK